MTDITGFGLLGHGYEMATQSAVDFHIQLARIPWLPGAIAYGEAGAFPGGMDNNTRYFGQWVTFGPDISYMYRDMLFTPETSGGLLVALAQEKVNTFTGMIPEAAVLGTVEAGNGHIWID